MKLLKYEEIEKVNNEDKVIQPDSFSNHIGLEVEFYSPYEAIQLTQLVYEFGLDDVMTVKGDGSLSNDEEYGKCAHEITVLMKEANFQRTLKKVCDLLEKAEAFVEDDCGLHVHIDIRNRDTDRVFHNLVYAQPLLYSLNPSHRLDNGYSEPTTCSDFSTVDHDRTGINPCSVSKHETIEIRIHEGTVKYKDILNWISLLLSVVKCKGYKQPESLQDYVKAYNLTDSLKGYIDEKLGKRRLKNLVNISIDEDDEPSYNNSQEGTYGHENY